MSAWKPCSSLFLEDLSISHGEDSTICQDALNCFRENNLRVLFRSIFLHTKAIYDPGVRSLTEADRVSRLILTHFMVIAETSLIS